ncbi:acetyl-CoA C-acetyltransferase, partial [Micromonospora azadirachtae]
GSEVGGGADLVVAGGVESMTRVPMGSSVAGGMPFSEAIHNRYRSVEGFAEDSPLPFNQGVGAELIARRWRFSRAQLDEFALASHEKAAAAQDAGAFDPELAPVALGDGGKFAADEGIRRDTSLEKLAGLATPFRADGVVTAGSASQISDGAAALAVTTSEWASRHGLRPLARIHTAVGAADDPVTMLTAPIPATAKALRRAGLGIEEIGVYEVNEAFAPVP